ncbi:hypothetical protein K501DRAFT_274102 [Backusella circina FSU 941]|nr:hypothetical protein K501DRAFT_274102 [Backusella circina FSU 941]
MDDDSFNDSDAQPAPNDALMMNSLPESKAASPKTNKEISMPKGLSSSHTLSTRTSKGSDLISGSTTGCDKDVPTYPFHGNKAITIEECAIARVKDDKFLNDTIMEAYPKILQD